MASKKKGVPPKKDVKSFIDFINKEAGQEADARSGRDSVFEAPVSSERLVERAREFDDLTKHMVRRERWLPVAQKLFKKKKSGLRLLTLPGRHCLEVELYRKEKLLNEYREGPDTFLDAVVFETMPDVYGLLVQRSPQFRAVYNDDVVRVLAERREPTYSALLSLFPFDIINLDLTGNLVAPSEGPYGPVLAAIRECLKLQAPHVTGDWIFMMTFRAVVEHTDGELMDTLAGIFQRNLDEHTELLSACRDRHGVGAASDLLSKDGEEALSRFVAKWIVERGHEVDWSVETAEYIRYTRTPAGLPPYPIRKLVFRLSRKTVPKRYVPGAGKPSHRPKWQVDSLSNAIGGHETHDYDLRAAEHAKNPAKMAFFLADIEELKAQSGRTDQSVQE